MVAEPATPAWKRHELLSKAIFEALLKQSNAENLEVRHNITVKGRITDHQIDVFWRFRMASLDHFVIVQVKKRKEPAKKGDLLLFHDVLLDIPGQPRGVFVSEHGYQKGALEVAHAVGIKAFEIREISRDTPQDPATMTSHSVMFMTVRLDKLMLESEILQPTISNVRLTLDGPWLARHPQSWPENMPFTAVVTGVRFLDADGKERTSMQRLVQDRIKEFREAGHTLLEVEFPEPTYTSGIRLLAQDGTLIVSVDKLKIVKLTAALDITKTTVTAPLFTSEAATYLFRNAIEGDHRYVIVAEHGSDLVAQVSLSPKPFRVG
jgi:hypothetical protein